MTNLSGKIVRQARINRGLSQRDLAQAVDISPAYMNLIESGKRPVAGKLLKDIAGILTIDISALKSSKIEKELVVLESIAREFDLNDEYVSDFAIEHPNWVTIIGNLQQTIELQKQNIRTMSDGMRNDEVLSGRIHDLLSRIASIRSTASILNTQGDIKPEVDAQFREILHKEARQASEVARELVARMEANARANQPSSSPLEQFGEDLYNSHYHIAELEALNTTDHAEPILGWIEKQYGAEGLNAPLLIRLVLTLVRDIRALPRPLFMAKGVELNWSLPQLASHFDVPVDRILRRVAMVSKEIGLPKMSMVIADHTGQAWLETFQGAIGHRVKIECGHWPIYASPFDNQGVRSQILSVESGQNLYVHSASGKPANAMNMPTNERITTMLISKEMFDFGVEASTIVQNVGYDCTSCHEKVCVLRKNPAML